MDDGSPYAAAIYAEEGGGADGLHAGPAVVVRGDCRALPGVIGHDESPGAVLVDDLQIRHEAAWAAAIEHA